MSESKKTDWSKAPEWARKLGVNPHGENAWLGDEGYSYLLGNGGVVPWSYETAYAYTAFKIIESRPVVWNGEGLPPVGTVCQFNDGAGGEWKKVEVMYLSQYTILVKFDVSPGEDAEGAYSPEESTYFRPILTPEQIAAEERKLQKEQLAYLIAGYMGFDDPREVDTKLAAYIFDHEYRKQVAP